MRPFHLIVACSENRVIGRAGRLPWRIDEDRRFFEEQTAGQVLIMGRVCFQTWPGAIEEGRRTIVVTERNAGALPRLPAGVGHSLTQALEQAASLEGRIYLCGGQRLYEEGLVHPAAERLHLTLIHAHVEGDRSFPDWRAEFPVEIARRSGQEGNWHYTFMTLARKPAGPIGRTPLGKTGNRPDFDSSPLQA